MAVFKPCQKAGAKRIVRGASDDDVKAWERQQQNQVLGKRFCQERARELNLEMKVSRVDFPLYQGQATFYFTSEGRVDFRQQAREERCEHGLRARELAHVAGLHEQPGAPVDHRREVQQQGRDALELDAAAVAGVRARVHTLRDARGVAERGADLAADRWGNVVAATPSGWSGVPAGTPLFDSVVVYENYPVAETLCSPPPRQVSRGSEERKLSSCRRYRSA